MDEISSLANLIKEHGVSGVVVTFLIWDKFIQPKLKKKSGDYVSFSEIKEIKHQVIELKNEWKEHKSEEDKEIAVFAEIKAEQSHIREKFNDLKEMFQRLEDNQKDAFGLISKIKDRMMDDK